MANNGGGPDEQALAGQALAGAAVTARDSKDDEDFDEFFLRILPRTIRAARRLTGDPWMAEDVAVEALAAPMPAGPGSGRSSGATPGCSRWPREKLSTRCVAGRLFPRLPASATSPTT